MRCGATSPTRRSASGFAPPQPPPWRSTRPSVCSASSRRRCGGSRAGETASPLRLPAHRASASAEPCAQVGGGGSGAGLSRARRGEELERAERRGNLPVPPDPLHWSASRTGASRRCLPPRPGAACDGRPRVLCRACAGCARDCRSARRPTARTGRDGGDRGPARGLARSYAPVRLAPAGPAESRRRPGRPRCAAQCRWNPHRHRLHDRARARSRSRARRRVPGLHGLRLLPPGGAATAAGAAAGALRRRARALQERRQPGGGLAAGRLALRGDGSRDRRGVLSCAAGGREPGWRDSGSRPGREERAPGRLGGHRCGCRCARPRPERPRARRAARRRGAGELGSVDDLAGGVRVPPAIPGRADRRAKLDAMRAERIKQVLKNSVYRTIGETAAAIGANANGHRSLRVLMYHKVNDLPGNPLTMPVSLFDEQMDQLRELGYTVVGLEAVLDHYVHAQPLPPQAVLITFDDGYHDNLDNAARVLRKYGYPAVLFVPIGYLDDRHPLPHEEHLAAQGILNPTIDWEELVELDRAGIRIESHGISHRPLADLEVDEAAREIALSKLRLEER